MLVEVVLFLLLVCLTAGLQKMYWPVVHETWWKDVARAKEVTLKGVDLKLSEGYIYDVPLLQHSKYLGKKGCLQEPSYSIHVNSSLSKNNKCKTAFVLFKHTKQYNTSLYLPYCFHISTSKHL